MRPNIVMEASEVERVGEVQHLILNAMLWEATSLGLRPGNALRQDGVASRDSVNQGLSDGQHSK